MRDTFCRSLLSSLSSLSCTYEIPAFFQADIVLCVVADAVFYYLPPPLDTNQSLYSFSCRLFATYNNERKESESETIRAQFGAWLGAGRRNRSLYPSWAQGTTNAASQQGRFPNFQPAKIFH